MASNTQTPDKIIEEKTITEIKNGKVVSKTKTIKQNYKTNNKKFTPEMKKNIWIRFRTSIFMILFVIVCLILAVFSDYRDNGFTDWMGIPKYARGIFGILFLLSILWMIYFISKEIIYVFIKEKSKKDIWYITCVLGINIIVPAVILFASIYFDLNFNIGGNKNNLGMAYIYIGVMFLLPLLTSVLSIAVERRHRGISIFNRTYFPLVIALISIAFSSIYYLTIIHSFTTILSIILICVLSDTGAFFSGVCFGKHKMAPVISPKKTWEGFFGGQIIALILLMVIFYIASLGEGEDRFHINSNFFGWQYYSTHAFFNVGEGWMWWTCIPFVILFISVNSVLGDLLFSIFKRKNDIKDYSDIFPGHGGFLDRIDSVIVAISAYTTFSLFIALISTFIHPDQNSIFFLN